MISEQPRCCQGEECPGQVPDLRKAITPAWRGPLVHEPACASFNFNNFWGLDFEGTCFSGANKMETAWLSSFWPLYRKAMGGAVVLQEAYLAQAWALTEPGWAAPDGPALGRDQLESMCTAGSGKGWVWEGWEG